MSHVLVVAAWLTTDQITHANPDFGVPALLAYASVYYGLLVAFPLTVLAVTVTAVLRAVVRWRTGRSSARTSWVGLAVGPITVSVSLVMTNDDHDVQYIVAALIFAAISIIVRWALLRRSARRLSSRLRAGSSTSALMLAGVLAARLSGKVPKQDSQRSDHHND